VDSQNRQAAGTYQSQNKYMKRLRQLLLWGPEGFKFEEEWGASSGKLLV
jgi:hypothetical protein